MIAGRSIMNLMVILFIVNNAIGQTKEQVIEKYLKTIGGKEKWLAVRSKIDSGMIITYTSESFFNKEAKTDTVLFSTILEMPNKLKFTSYKRHRNSRIDTRCRCIRRSKAFSFDLVRHDLM